MACDCPKWFDCPCNPPDPSYDHKNGEIVCANCYGIIGEFCGECSPGP